MQAEVMRDLFAYGTLMCTDIMRAASGCRVPAGIPGLLREYCRLYVRGEHYPGLVPRPGSSVAGILYRSLPAAAWARLDCFEGEMYRRCDVRVETVSGVSRPAQTYLVRPEYAARLEERLWELEDFLRYGKTAFQSAYRGYAAIEDTAEPS